MISKVFAVGPVGLVRNFDLYPSLWRLHRSSFKVCAWVNITGIGAFSLVTGDAGGL